MAVGQHDNLAQVLSYRERHQTGERLPAVVGRQYRKALRGKQVAERWLNVLVYIHPNSSMAKDASITPIFCRWSSVPT